LACLVDDDFAGLQVAMNDAALMSMVHRIANLRDEFQTRSQVEMPLLGELDEGLPLDILHSEVRLRTEAAVGGAGFLPLCKT
jgi:hypothetical protein